MAQKVLKTVKQAKDELKARLVKVLKDLPDNWSTLFISENKEYLGNRAFLHNVAAGRSLHEETILLLEKFVKLPHIIELKKTQDQERRAKG